jgi:hypothetical protein
MRQRDPAHVHRCERPQLLPSPDLGGEVRRIAHPIERLRSIPASLPPPNPEPDRSVLQNPPLDLHPATSSLLVATVKDAIAW